MTKVTDLKLFNILGPVMIGPSSSHTAGACRIALMARQLFSGKINSVRFQLHGSFAHTYKGHGSDRALAGGILGYEPDDERLITAVTDAQAQGLKLEFKSIDLGNVHPNSVRIKISGENDVLSIIGASIGGGAIRIINVDGTEVDFSGEYPTLVLRYQDQLGMVTNATRILTEHGINIATMQVRRHDTLATMVIELDEPFNAAVLQAFEDLPNILFFKAVPA